MNNIFFANSDFHSNGTRRPQPEFLNISFRVALTSASTVTF